MELTLPGMAPRNTRKCEFVEGDSAFVSWDGNVHPCYFLWHRYACYVGGIEKRVKPWVFGNLRDRDILAIWNDEDSRSFRERVLGYQFPFCFDCGFALCDYVGEEEFEQDCYIERVPCGACLWCTGLVPLPPVSEPAMTSFHRFCTHTIAHDIIEKRRSDTEKEVAA